MFSQSTDNMGLTDIEMTQLDYEDPYYDDRQYEVEYEVRIWECVYDYAVQQGIIWKKLRVRQNLNTK